MLSGLVKELVLFGSAEGRKLLLLKELKELKESKEKTPNDKDQVARALDEALAKELKSL